MTHITPDDDIIPFPAGWVKAVVCVDAYTDLLEKEFAMVKDLKQLVDFKVEHIKHFTQTYDIIFNMCIQRDPYNWSANVYDKCVESIENNLISRFVPSMEHAKAQSPKEFLWEWTKRWQMAKNLANVMNRIFMYLNRFYIPNSECGKVSALENVYCEYLRRVYEPFQKRARKIIFTTLMRAKMDIVDRELEGGRASDTGDLMEIDSVHIERPSTELCLAAKKVFEEICEGRLFERDFGPYEAQAQLEMSMKRLMMSANIPAGPLAGIIIEYAFPVALTDVEFMQCCKNYSIFSSSGPPRPLKVQQQALARANALASAGRTDRPPPPAEGHRRRRRTDVNEGLATALAWRRSFQVQPQSTSSSSMATRSPSLPEMVMEPAPAALPSDLAPSGPVSSLRHRLARAARRASLQDRAMMPNDRVRMRMHDRVRMRSSLQGRSERMRDSLEYDNNMWHESQSSTPSQEFRSTPSQEFPSTPSHEYPIRPQYPIMRSSQCSLASWDYSDRMSGQISQSSSDSSQLSPSAPTDMCCSTRDNLSTPDRSFTTLSDQSFSSTPSQPFMSTPSQQINNTPSQQFMSTPSQSSSSTPSQQFRSAPSQPFNNTPSQQFMSTPSQSSSSTPSQQFRCAPSQPFMGTPSQPFNNISNQWFSSTPSQSSMSTPSQQFMSTPTESPLAVPSAPSQTSHMNDVMMETNSNTAGMSAFMEYRAWHGRRRTSHSSDIELDDQSSP
eukprot:235379_1